MLGQILGQIAVEGPIPFERFMEIALYSEGGFFGGEVLRSQKGADFLTSPEVSPMFGSTLAELVRRKRSTIDGAFRLVEVAAGSGSLLEALLEAEPVEAWAVEVSPAACRQLETILPADRVKRSLGEVPDPFSGMILANELIDNLPMAMAQKTEAGWRERWVGAGDGRLEMVDAPARPEVSTWLDSYAGPVDVGGWVEVQLAAAAWLTEALSKLDQGAVVLFDYGDTADGLESRRAEGTMRTYRSHHLGPHPLEEPGATDITADVNFTALERVAVEAGATVELWRQDDLLTDLGLRGAIDEIRHQELELARAGDDLGRLRLRSRRSDAETLLHPRGLGDFRVLIATKGR